MLRVVLLSSWLVACGVVSEQGECTPATCGGCCVREACVRGAACQGGAFGSFGKSDAAVPSDAGADAGARSDGGPDASVFLDAGLDAGQADAGPADAGAPCASAVRVPVNEARDAEFECAGATAFRSTGGGGQVDAVPGRSGKGVRFTTAGGLFDNEFASTWTFQVTRAGRYCARAFVRGSAASVTLRLFLGPPGSAAGEQFELPGPNASWTRIPPTVPAVSAMGQPGDVGFLVFIEKSHAVGATIELDDVDVWRSEDGACRDR